MQALFGANDPRDGGVRPTVRLARRGLPPAALGIIALVMAVLLFMVLNGHRAQPAEPRVAEPVDERSGSAWPAPPPLYIPPVQEPVYAPAPTAPAEPAQKPAVAPVPAPATQVRVVTEPARAIAEPLPTPIERAPPVAQPVPRSSGGSPLVIDSGTGPEAASPQLPGGAPTLGAARTDSVARMRASALASPSMTVPQGYLIPAVLETGFDSTKPGYARAVVSRDVRSFDGKNVLIPRGSRLIGESEAATGRGQNRAVITWTRLIRPDGMTISLDSPAVDPAGRTGIAASVNNHFFARLGDALLQSSFAIGQALAGRAATGTVVVVGSNAATTGSRLIAPATNYLPTLKVEPGKSISVFVAHDLDFSAAGRAR